MTDEDVYKKYGIDPTPKKGFDKEKLEKTMDDIAYCRAHLEKINETREALFKVLDELPLMHEQLLKMQQYVTGVATHVMRVEQFLGLEDYGVQMDEDGRVVGGQ
jgi:hypothetical protein